MLHLSTGTRRKSGKAFTIVEVMMASTVMAFALSTSVLVIMGGFRSIDVARNMTLASQVLQSEMERIRLMDWGDLHALQGQQNVDLATVFTANTAITSRFTLVRTVSDVTAKVGEMKMIVLHATWTTTSGRSVSRSFTNYYTKNGLYDYYYTLARS
tara:strand:+ start:888 stop:1355 length:468 start_codon:yes stop_codon:yes gene_type:complete